jgi:hypothetical protein
MKITRDSMVIYRSFYDAIKELPEKNQLEILKQIFEFGLDGIESELTGISKTIWILIKPNLEANRTKWESGCKAKKKQSRSKAEAKPKQEASKTEANVYVDVDVDENEDVNVDVKVKIDLSDLSKYESKYDKNMLDEFKAYWTETDQKGRMRFQAQKFFDISKRLATWKRNSTDFHKNKKEASTDVPQENAPYKPPHQKGVDFSNCIPKTKQ